MTTGNGDTRVSDKRKLMVIGLDCAPPALVFDQWRADLEDISTRLTECCRAVDPQSTEKALEQAAAEASEDMGL